MDRQKRHELTPAEHVSELRNDGEINVGKEIEELARNEHTQTLAQLTGGKKTLSLILLLAGEIEKQKREIFRLSREVSKLKARAA